MKPLSLVCHMLLVVFSFAAVLLATQAYNDISLRQDREAVAYQDARTVLAITSSEWTRMVSGVRNLLVGIAADAPDAVTAPHGCRRLDAVTKGRFMGRLAIWILDAQGRTVCSTDPSLGLPPPAALAAARALASGAPATGSIVPAAGPHGPSIPLAQPWGGSGGGGSVLALLDINWIGDVFGHRPLPPMAAAALVTGGSEVIVASPWMPPGKPMHVLDAEGAEAVIRWPDGVARFTAWAVADSGAPAVMAVAGVSRSATLRPFRLAEQRMVVTACVAIAAGLAAVLLGVPAIAGRPLRALANAADLIGSGRRNVRVRPDGAPEIRRLAESVNRMAANLEAAEAAQASALASAEDANLSKSRFLAAASHDLRQPLQAMSMFAASVAAGVEGTGAAVACGNLMVSLETMRSLLDNLLDASRLESGSVEANFESFQITGLLKEIQSSYAPAAIAKGLTMTVNQEPAWVRSDRMLLGRMLRNLLDNAVRYTESGGITIICRTGRGCLDVEVRDTGVGIPDAAHEVVWQEFTQLWNQGRSRNNGLGLGLSIVSRLSKVLGHPVTMRSAAGEGSAFTVRIPLADDAPRCPGSDYRGR